MKEMETVTVFKVVRKSGISGKFLSASVYEPGWVLEYRLGETIEPERGFIFAFDTYYNARHWCDECYAVDGMTRRVILESDGIVINREPPGMSAHLMSPMMTDFWDGALPRSFCSFILPAGTVWCSGLKPVRVLEE